MVLKGLLTSNKPLLEKYRMIIYRIRKKKYIFMTKIHNKNYSTDYCEVNTPTFFFDENVIQKFSEIYKNEVTLEAKRLLGNSYRDISGNLIIIDGSIDWNKDYIFNYTWERKHYSKYVLKDKNISTDVKHVWELSRFYHLVILAKAYIINNDEVYVQRIIDDVLSWEEQNPFNQSVNWTVSMEVAIRTVNLIQAVTIIKKSNSLNAEVNQKLNSFIYRSGEYIWNNLEKGLNTNNHYLSNLIGLIWIAIYFMDGTDSRLKKISNKYLEFSLDQLKYELVYQINNDGFSYEDSVSYHGLNTEMLLLTTIVLDKNNIVYPQEIKNKVISMTLALKNLMIGDSIPLFGDIDNGRLIICDICANRDKTNFGYLIKIGIESGIINNDVISEHSPVSYNESGIYRIFNRNLDAIIRCGKIGLNGIGGHAHNDQLSFVLNIMNEQILVDPGTGYYSGDYDLRRLLRSTESHNTMNIKNFEQNIIDIDLFKMIEKTQSKVIHVGSNSFEGIHYGYYPTHGIEYRRKIKIYKDNIKIIDEVSRFPIEQCYINFIFDQDVKLKLIDNKSLYIQKKHILAKLEVKKGNISILNQFISKSYGDVTYTNKVKIIMEGERVETVIKLIGKKEYLKQ